LCQELKLIERIHHPALGTDRGIGLFHDRGGDADWDSVREVIMKTTAAMVAALRKAVPARALNAV
jgi:hypothetical protein